ncbi:hypothetical protein DFH08DRAFT_164120 [Mycena albidolilacea]|uniref:Uncharacterized protein n=1 Tax=Mycena albidolilacea TaxID=1033008 RepID=A0AAD7F477_9AGAR|nr:hypothetical protein DFH08DRAFT_164120 [Mycena albidolilacea]
MCATTAVTRSPPCFYLSFFGTFLFYLLRIISLSVCCCPAVDIPPSLYLSLYLISPPWPSLPSSMISLFPSAPFFSLLYLTITLRLHSHSDPPTLYYM